MQVYFKNSVLLISIVFILSLLVDSSALGAEPLTWDQINDFEQPESGLILSYGTHEQQFAELMLPEGEGPFPVLIWLHGGCWFAEYDYQYTRPLARAIADLGYAVWSIEYRRIGHVGGGWPGTFADVGGATDYLRKLAEQHPLNLQSVIAAGHSAGGQLALWLASRSDLDEGPIASDNPLPIHKVIALAPAADLSRMAREQTCGNAAVKLLGGTPEEVASRYRQTSPSLRVPMVEQLIIDGAEDETWSSISGQYVQEARKANAPVTQFVVPNAGHFDLVAPEGEAWRVLSEALRLSR